MNVSEDSFNLATGEPTPAADAAPKNRPGCLALICFYFWSRAALGGAVAVVSLFTQTQLTGLALANPTIFIDQLVANSNFSTALLMIVSIFVSIFLVAITVFYFVVGMGLWRLRPWARQAALIVSGLVFTVNLLFLLVALVNGSGVRFHGLIFNGLILWGLSREPVRTAFK
jgi:hypothetical protein